jgi:hypothetical protein
MGSNGIYPLVNVYITMERSTILNGKIRYFDWAIFNSKLFVYQAGQSFLFYSPIIISLYIMSTSSYFPAFFVED